ncbi:MAG: hypothetical protein ACK559_08765 [bacterium]
MGHNAVTPALLVLLHYVADVLVYVETFRLLLLFETRLLVLLHVFWDVDCRKRIHQVGVEVCC